MARRFFQRGFGLGYVLLVIFLLALIGVMLSTSRGSEQSSAPLTDANLATIIRQQATTIESNIQALMLAGNAAKEIILAAPTSPDCAQVAVCLFHPTEGNTEYLIPPAQAFTAPNQVWRRNYVAPTLDINQYAEVSLANIKQANFGEDVLILTNLTDTVCRQINTLIYPHLVHPSSAIPVVPSIVIGDLLTRGGVYNFPAFPAPFPPQVTEICARTAAAPAGFNYYLRAFSTN